MRKGRFKIIAIFKGSHGSFSPKVAGISLTRMGWAMLSTDR
jgi:hypothetical protein